MGQPRARWRDEGLAALEGLVPIRNSPRISALFLLAILAATLSSCADRKSEWPTRGWRTSTLEAQGINPGRISAALDYIRANNTGIRSLLIVRNGYLASENYFQGYDRNRLGDLYSVTKSVVSTLVGIAIDQGKIEGLRTPISGLLEYGPPRNPDPLKDAMTIEDALTMRSGLDWTEGDKAYAAFYGSSDAVGFVLGQRMRGSPGGVFNYDSGVVHLLSAGLGKRTGMDSAAFARRYLFGPLGIRRVEWEKDRNGIPIGGWGLRMTPRDMAKLGYLMLRGGSWDGRQVVGKAWVDSATGERVMDTGSPDGLRYGYLWWVYPAVGGFAALGLEGQTILVVPRLDLVVVITASTPDRGHRGIFPLIADYIVPAMR
jgi:CubicO group peptidase (beta-lactamase class C family)